MRAAILALACAAVLSGCERGDYGMADYSVVCDPRNATAFYVEPGSVHTSFLRRSPQFDALCKQEKQG